MLQFIRQYPRVHIDFLGLDLIQALCFLHRPHIAFQPPDIVRHDIQRIHQFLLGNSPLRYIAFQQVCVSPKHRKRRAQIVGEGGIELFAFLHHGPHLSLVIQKLQTHLLKAVAELSQFVLIVVGNGEIQIIAADPVRSLLKRLQRPLQFIAVKQSRFHHNSYAWNDKKGPRLYEITDIHGQPFIGAHLFLINGDPDRIYVIIVFKLLFRQKIFVVIIPVKCVSDRIGAVNQYGAENYAADSRNCRI